MYTILLLSVLGTILGITHEIKQRRSAEPYDGPIMLIMGPFGGFVLAILVAQGLKDLIPLVEVVDEVKVAGVDYDGPSNGFNLLMQQPDGSYTVKVIPLRDQVSIREETIAEPLLRTRHMERVKNHALARWALIPKSDHSKATYELILPVGTVTDRFRLWQHQ